MSYRIIFEDIKNADIAKIYLFYGNEEYVKDQALQQLVKAVLPKGIIELNHHILDGSTVGAGDIVNACETLPFMADRKLVVVKDFPMVSNKKSEGQPDRLSDYLKRIPKSVCLVFLNRGDVDKRGSLFGSIKKFGKVIEFAPLKQDELHRWVTGALRKNNKQMDRAAILRLVYLVGNKLEDLNNELLKLTAYTSEKDIITAEDVDLVVVPNLEHSVFQLFEAIGVRDGGKALILFHQLLAEGENSLSVLAMFARQIRLLMLCRCHRNRGITESAIAQKVEGHPYAIKRCIEQSRNFTLEQLKQGLSRCLEVDYGIKSGKVKERMGIELLIISMCEK